MAAEDVQAFLYAFFPFLFGVYPYAVPTEKQKEAMALANFHDARLSIYALIRSLAVKLLRDFTPEQAKA